MIGKNQLGTAGTPTQDGTMLVRGFQFKDRLFEMPRKN